MKSYNEIFDEDHETTNVRKIEAEELPDFEVLCAGFPCQAFSIAGERGGFEDTRGTLFFEIARIAEEKLPEILLLENVKGLLNHSDGATFRKILSTLDELGYDVEWQVLNSKYHGVPQNRERVFIIGYLRGRPRRQVFPFREPDQRNAGEDGGIELNPKGWEPDKQLNDGSEVSLCIDKNYFKGLAPSKIGDGRRTHVLDWHGHKDKAPKIREDVPTLRANSHGHQPKVMEKKEEEQEDPAVINHQMRPESRPSIEEEGQSGGSGILFNEEGYSYTLSSSPHYVKAENEEVRIRKLTPKECWRLQGFPDWAFEAAEEVNSDTQLYKQAGNSVTVNVVEDIAERLFR